MISLFVDSHTTHPPHSLSLILRSSFAVSDITYTVTTEIMIKAIQCTVQCHCGQVKVVIDSPSALRFVCYSKDCRGYVQSLNELAEANGHPPIAKLDPWGGVDYTQIYPSEIAVKDGQDRVKTVLIRPESPIRRVYASCCYTPLFDIGNVSALLNTHLLAEDVKPDVRFRIMGRHSLPSTDKTPKPSSLSWGVPFFSWIFVMGRRIQKNKMEPMPIDLKEQPEVMKNFHEG